MSDRILLGFEVGSGEPVYLPLHHLAIFGMTQLSGKTTALEALISRSGLRAIAFIVKRGEAGFTEYNQVTPYYKPRADWQFVEGLVNVALGEKVKYEPGMRYAIMKVCRGHKDLKEIQQAARDLAKGSKREFMKSVYEKLDAYLDIVIPELEKWVFTERLELSEGVNVMDLSGMRLETQHIVIASTIEYAFVNLDHIIVIIPEAWETIPQSKMTPVKWVAQQFIRKGAALGNYLWLDSQDIGGIDKTPLRQCDNWLMGRMKEAHEVERILKQLLGMKIAAEEIQTLALGHFYAAIGNDVKKVYVLPAGVPEPIGVEVALGKRNPESIRDEFLKVKVMDVDEMVWKERFEEEKRKREELEKEFTRQVERVSDLKAEEKINKVRKELEDLKNAPVDSSVNVELEEFRSGRKLAESVQRRLKFLGEVKLDLEKKIEVQGEELKLYAELQSVIRQLVNVKQIYDHIDAVRNTLEKPLLELAKTHIADSKQDGAAAVAVTESIPEIHHWIERPIVQTDESNNEGRLLTIALKSSFFESKQRIGGIVKELERVYAVKVTNTTQGLNPALESLIQKKILQREVSPSGGWLYWLVDGAKERIKETS